MTLYAVKDVDSGQLYDGSYMGRFFSDNGRAFRSLGALKQSLTGFLVGHHWNRLTDAQKKEYVTKALEHRRSFYLKKGIMDKYWNEEHQQDIAAQHGGPYAYWNEIKKQPLQDLLPPSWRIIEISVG